MGKKFIDCPSGKDSADECPWEIRTGSIRDFPEYGVEECKKCNLVSHETDLRASTNYESGSMHAWTKGYGGTLETPKEDVSRRVSAIRDLATKHQVSKILDFGSGNGEMMEAPSESFEVLGLEPEAHARIECIARGMNVWANSDELLTEAGKFDLITLFHVVEHFYNPKAELRRILELLKPGGIILMETPNSEDALLTLYQSQAFANFTYWSHHPMLHSRTSLINLATIIGFENVSCTGVQRYGIANHMYWLSQQKAGGHVHWRSEYSPATDTAYSRDLIQRGVSDTLWLTATKP